MKNILVTGVGGGVGQGIIKSLKLIKDLKVNILVADANPYSAGLYAGDKSFIVPLANDPNYLEKLIDLLNKEKVDFYLPGTDVELNICSENKNLIEKNSNTIIHISSSNVINIANDKLKTALFLKENGFPYLKTILKKDIDNKIDDMDFPIIAKPRHGYRSIGVIKLNNRDELLNNNIINENYILQEMAGTDSNEFTCTTIKVGEKVSKPLMLRRTLRAGDTFQAELESIKPVEGFLTEITKKLNQFGSCNYQLRIKNDIPYVFEINPRFSGTTPFLSALGFNPVEFFIKANLGMDYKYIIKKNKIVLRSWSEMIVDKSMIKLIEKNKRGTPTEINRSIL